MGVESNFQIQHEVAQVLALRQEFYRAIGIEEESKRQSYELPVARANFERRVLKLSEDKQEEVKGAFLSEERQHLRTALGERYHTTKRTTQYKLIDGELYSPDFPDEPFTQVIKRGKEYCKKIDSRETKREEYEESGYGELQKVIATKPVGTKVIMFSPPGLVKDTMYPMRFIDIWEVKENPDESRYGEVTRFTTNLDYEGYKKGARNIKPDYFNEWYVQNEHLTDEEKIPLDAWFVGNPIQLSDEYKKIDVEEIFDKSFEVDYATMQEQMFQEVLLVCWPLAEYYLSELCKGERDFVSIADSFTAILARADQFIEDREKYGEVRNALVVIRETQRRGMDIQQQAMYWSQQEVTVRATNCGESKGFKRNKFGQIQLSYGFENPAEALLNSVSGNFLENDNSEEDGFECPNCRIGWVKNGTNQCNNTKCGMTKERWIEEHPELACA